MNIADDMYDTLSHSDAETLVRQGFRVGTARKYLEMDSSKELKNTTIDTLSKLAKAISEISENDVSTRFERFLTGAFRVIDEVPRSELLKRTSLSSTMIANIKNNGREHNYQTSKFLTIADVAYVIYEEQESTVEVTSE